MNKFAHHPPTHMPAVKVENANVDDADHGCNCSSAFICEAPFVVVHPKGRPKSEKTGWVNVMMSRSTDSKQLVEKCPHRGHERATDTDQRTTAEATEKEGEKVHQITDLKEEDHTSDRPEVREHQCGSQRV